MTDQDLLDVLGGGELIPANASLDLEVVNNEGNEKRQRARSAAQGLTFGGADEAEAWLRSTFNGEDYDEALKDVRGKLEAYRGEFPMEALGFELGGASLPAIAGAVLSGGTSTATVLPTLARVGAVAAAEGGSYAFLTGEGKEDRLNRIPGGVTLGLAGAGLGYAGGKVTFGAGKKLLDFARRKFGPRAAGSVEREIKSAMKAAGIKDIDEAADMIARGELLADNATISTIVRGYRDTSRAAGEVLEGVYGKNAKPTRQDALRQETMDYLQEHMADSTDPNVLRQFTASQDEIRQAASKEYNEAFALVPDVGDEMAAELAESIRRVPEAQKDLNKLYRAKTGQTPFFKFGDDGAVEFTRNPNLEEAEIVRRAIRDAGSREYRSGASAVGQAIGDVDSALKSTIDGVSLPLSEVRAKWSGIEAAREAFEEGRKAMTRGTDQVALDFDKWSRNEGTLSAFRAGVMDAYRRKATTGAAASMPRTMSREGHKDRGILEIVFPGDNIDELIGKATKATKAQDAATTILGGSQTSSNLGRRDEQGVGLLSAGLDIAMDGGVATGLKMARQVLRGLRSKLSPEDAEQAARLMVESNPEIFRKAMTDRRAADQITALGVNALKRLDRKSYAAGAQVANPAYEGLIGREIER